jgi:hypothetical protein
MGETPRKARWPFLLAGAVVTVSVVFVIWLLRGRQRSSAEELPHFPLPPYSATQYLNTGLDVHYVGINVCAECHRANHSSFLHTAHSQAMADLDPAAEPPDGTYHHQPSGRSYRVYRQGEQFRHEEILRTASGKEVARVDLPIRFLMGSGHFSRSYLVEVDGFLHESPITWYTSKKKWDMSPGYDFAGHWSFERAINLHCLSCHAGRVEQARDSVKMTIHEKAIGCESCHGPGSRHVELHRARKYTPGEDDFTIVNPAKLSRARLEDVCSACHLSGSAPVPVRGRKFTDFRPSMPLTDYRIEYRFDTGNEQMTVVGHMEQLRQSVCYQKSSDMTCLTCHDPHAKEKPKDPVAFFRQKCLNCHQTESCQLTPAERIKKNAADDCSACHMPRGDTDIPHIAFTHHRIGRHTSPPASTALTGRTPELVPVEDVAYLPQIDQQRNLGLAYLQVSRDRRHSQYAETFTTRARELLEAVYAAGLRDGVITQNLASIYWKIDPARAAKYADEALTDKDLIADVRAAALVVRADCHLHNGELDAAIALLEELVTLRRQAEDWRLLGKLYLDRNEPQRALQAYQKALAIRPFRYEIHGGLGEAYRLLGNNVRAREHLERAQWLLQNRPE